MSGSSIDLATKGLWKIAIEAEDGALLGSEELLTATLGISRATLRQAARLLEREGVLKVRRGIRGGYFATRPGVDRIVSGASAYLETLNVDPGELFNLGSFLWGEALRKAASLRTEDARALAGRLREKVAALRDDASFTDVYEIEHYCRTRIFGLIEDPYIELIFNVNLAFSRRKQYADPSKLDGTRTHREFVRAWRRAKLIELETIADGDEQLAVMAAQHLRHLLHRRIWGHDPA
jgi:DNA-binding FadR family transcriptional regulator